MFFKPFHFHSAKSDIDNFSKIINWLKLKKQTTSSAQQRSNEWLYF